MSLTIQSTRKIDEHTARVFVHHLMTNLKERMMKIVAAFGECYFTSSAESHIRHYVDPITGRAIPVKKC